MPTRRKAIVGGLTVVAVLWGPALIERGPAAATIVHVYENSLDPDTLVIGRGEEVIWEAAIAAGPPHFKWMPTPKSVRVRVTEQDDFAATFDVPGEYRYVIPIGRGGRVDAELPGKIIVK